MKSELIPLTSSRMLKVLSLRSSYLPSLVAVLADSNADNPKIVPNLYSEISISQHFMLDVQHDKPVEAGQTYPILL